MTITKEGLEAAFKANNKFANEHGSPIWDLGVDLPGLLAWSFEYANNQAPGDEMAELRHMLMTAVMHGVLSAARAEAMSSARRAA